MSKSFSQKSAVIWSLVKANPTISDREVSRRLIKTGHGMNNQDRRSLVNQFKDAVELKDKIKHSNMRSGTKEKPEAKERITKGLYHVAKRQSRRGKKLYPPKKDARGKETTIKETIENIFGGKEPVDGEYDFYGRS